MNQPINSQQPKRIAIAIIAMQAAILFLVFAISLFFASAHHSLSLLMGGLCALLPAIGYTALVFARTRAQDVKRIVLSLYGGEFMKLILSAVLVVVMLTVFHLSLAFVLAGFIITLLAFFVAPLFGFINF